MSSNVDKIKDRISIVDIVSTYIKLEKAGRNMKARCPFHSERTPSFIVSPDRGTYHCFGCGVGGDIFTFIQEIEGLDFKGALKLLAEKAGVQLTHEKQDVRNHNSKEILFKIIESTTLLFNSNISSESSVIKYLHERGIEDNTIKRFRIGWADESWTSLKDTLEEKGFSDMEIKKTGLVSDGKHGIYDRFRSRIMFPVFDVAGRVIAFSGRAFVLQDTRGETPKNMAKYINSPETELFHKSAILYGLNFAKQSIRRMGFTILVEGQIDLILSHQIGWVNTVAVLGTALTETHILYLKRLSDNIVIALDGDIAGIKATIRSAKIAMLGGMDVKVVEMPKGTDPADIIRDKGKDEWSKRIKDSKHIITFLLDILKRDSKDDRQFQKHVEASVLPIITDLPNPIDREKFVQEIASRMRVSEKAVFETIDALKQQNTYSPKIRAENVIGAVVNKPVGIDRVRLVYGIYLWQKSVKDPKINLKVTMSKIRKIVSDDVLDTVIKASDKDAEEMCFRAEQLYYNSCESLEHEIDNLLQIIHKESLIKRLKQATVLLRQAEEAGNKEEIDAAMMENKKIADERALLG